MAADKQQKITLITQVDERIIRRSIALVRQLSAEQEDLASVNREAAKATDTFSGGMRQSEIRLRNRIALFKEERKAILESAAAIRTRNAEEASQAQRRIGAISGVERGIGGIASLVPGAGGDALRGIGNVVGLGADLPKISAGIATVGLSVGAVATASLIAAPAVIGVALAVKEFTKQLEGGKAALTDAIAAQSEYYRLLFGPTTSGEIRASISEVETNLAALRATRADVIAQREGSTQAGNEQGGLSAVASAVAYIALNKQLEENKAAIESAERELYGLNRALKSAEVAARDAAAAQAAQVAGSIANLRNEAQARLDAETFGATASREAYEQRLAAIEREKSSIQAQIVVMEGLSHRSEAARAELALLNENLENLEKAERNLVAVSYPLIRARERETDAAAKLARVTEARERFNDDMLRLEQQASDERIRIAENTAQRIGDIARRLFEQETAIAADLQRGDDDATRKFEDDISAINTAARDREIETRLDSSQRIEDLVRRHEAEVRRIKADGARDERDALLNRDAVALDKAQRTREEGLDEADSQLKEGIAQEKKSLKEQLEAGKRADAQRLRDLKTSYDQERRDRQIAASQKLADARAAAQAETSLARLAGQDALNALAARLVQEKQKLASHFGEQLRSYGLFYGNLATMTASQLNFLASTWAEFFRRVGTTAPTTTTTTTTTRQPGVVGRNQYGSRDYGGGFTKVGDAGQESIYAPRGSDIYSHRETKNILRALAGGKTGGSIGAVSITINTQSSDAAGIMREVQAKFPKLLADTLEKLQ